MELTFSLAYVVFIVFVIRKVLQASKENKQRNRSAGNIQTPPQKRKSSETVVPDMLQKRFGKTISDDGHVVPESQDLTCETRHGHHHASTGPRYIVHEEPERGYVVLNGVKRRLTDCRNL